MVQTNAFDSDPKNFFLMVKRRRVGRHDIRAQPIFNFNYNKLLSNRYPPDGSHLLDFADPDKDLNSHRRGFYKDYRR